MDSDEERSESDGDDNSDEENSDEEENNSASPSPDNYNHPRYLINTCRTNVLDAAAELFGKNVYKYKKVNTKEGKRSCIPYRDAGCIFAHGGFTGVSYYTDKSLTQDFLSKLSFDDLNKVDKTVSTSKIFSIISNSR